MSTHREPSPSDSRVQVDALLDLLPGVVYRCRAEPGWPMQFISPAITRLTGYGPEAFLRSGTVRFGDLVHPEDRPALDATVAEAIAAERPFTARYRLLHRDGSERHVFEQGAAVATDADGTRILEGYIADVSDAHGLATTLAAMQAEFRALFESAPGCYLVLSPDTFTIVAVSEAYLQATDRTRDSLLHRGVFEAFPADPSDPAGDGIANLRSSLERVLHTKRADAMAVQRYPIPRPAALGGGFEERYWSSLNSPVLGPDGRVAYIIHRVEDVTEYVRSHAATSDAPVDDRTLRMESDIVARARELQLANEQLRVAQQRIQDTFDSAAIGIAMLDPDGSIVLLNRAICELLGADEPTLLATPLERYLVPDDRPRVRALISRLLETGGHREQLELRVLRSDGAERWVRASLAPVRASQGKPRHVMAVLDDVTDSRRAAEAIRASEERFRLLSRATNDAIWDWDLVTDALWWNEGYESLFGRSRSAVSPTISSWSDYIHPDDYARTLAEVRAVIDGGGDVYAGEYRFRRADGSYAWVLDRGHIIRNAAGEPIRMIGGMTDLTERVLAEERVAQQAALLDAATDAILVRTLDHTITYWNKGAEAIYGWSSAEAIGQPTWKLLHRDPAAFHTATRQVLEHGRWSGEFEHRTKSGETRIIFGRWTLMRDRHGAPQAVLAINSDVTEQRRIERQFLRSQRLESIGTLAGGIAHDLNNVLTPILMAIELLRFETAADVREELLTAIEQNTKRGADMVRQVLTFARGVEGRRTRTRVGDICRDVAKIAADTFPKNIRVHLDVSVPVPAVNGDATQLHQVLLNLCVNARDAMPRGGDLRVVVRVVSLDAHHATQQGGVPEGPYVVVSVEDSGEGMPPEVLDKIFEPFFTTKELGRGTGLGLSTSQAIVKSHGGFIRVHSEPGCGSRFEVFLPVPDADAETGGTELPPDLPRGRGELILVVDDESSIRQMTQQTLEAFGYAVLAAADGAEAISVFAQHQEDIAVVLTDMMMPVMDGPAMIRVLRRMRPDVQIVAASGLTSHGPAMKAAEQGVRHILEKPYTAEALLCLLRDVLTDTDPAQAQTPR